MEQNKIYNIAGKKYIIDPTLEQYDLVKENFAEFDNWLNSIKQLIDGEDLDDSQIAKSITAATHKLTDPGERTKFLNLILTEQNKDWELNDENRTAAVKKLKQSQIGEIVSDFFTGWLDSIKIFLPSSSDFTSASEQ